MPKIVLDIHMCFVQSTILNERPESFKMLTSESFLADKFFIATTRPVFHKTSRIIIRSCAVTIVVWLQYSRDMCDKGITYRCAVTISVSRTRSGPNRVAADMGKWRI